jgi:3-oxoadipate enol-lactonase
MAVVKVYDLDIGYNERGHGAGDAVVFLHGVGSDKSVWDAQLGYLSATRRVLALDYPGYGESSLPAYDLNLEEVARYVFGAMDTLRIERAHIVGLSMGGVVGLEMQRQHPARLRSLVLADAFAKHPLGQEIIERSHRAVATMTMRHFAEQRVEVLLTANASPIVRQNVVETMARIDKRTYRWSSQAVWTADYREHLSSITTPTLVLVGEDDQPTPPELSEELANNISGAKLEIIARAGHLSNLDRPALFNSIVRQFIESIERVEIDGLRVSTSCVSASYSPRG